MGSILILLSFFLALALRIHLLDRRTVEVKAFLSWAGLPVKPEL